MWRRGPGTAWRRVCLCWGAVMGRAWLADFSEMKAEKGRIRCHRYIRGLNFGEERELFNCPTMLAQEQLDTGCPWMHLDNVNRWKTVIQKLKTKNRQQQQQNPQTKSFSDYKVIEMELRKASRDLLILSFLTFGNMTTAYVVITFFIYSLLKSRWLPACSSYCFPHLAACLHART